MEDTATQRLVCCARVLPLAGGGEIGSSYAAQHYDLGRLSAFAGPMLELGRFCVRPGVDDPDILRVAWAALTRLVDDCGIELVFGCSSFAGTDAGRHAAAFALLRERHLAPERWRPSIRAGDVVRFGADRPTGANRRAGLRHMPPLLRSYLAMGGWVSDHAVVDTNLNTLHVFTGLEIRAIPAARARALRLVAG